MNEQNDLFLQRLSKLTQIREKGINPYPYRFEATHLSSGIIGNFEELSASNDNVRIAGRLMSVRGHGKTSFAHLQDGAGRIQIYLRKDTLGEELFALYELLDIGDMIGVEGTVFQTRTGEITVQTQGIEILCKSLRPLPIEKERMEGGQKVTFDEVSDKELRYRQRYVDLILHPEVRQTFQLRTKIVSAMRRFLDNRDFMEVETPVLQPLYGGASARPFVTHHNALDFDLYLRISDELYLKRLIVGGFERVYEFCKDFRNEGMDRSHNPEFTLLELYQAYADYGDMMRITEEMVSHVAQEVVGSLTVAYQGTEIDFSPPWKRVTMLEAIAEYAGIDVAGLSEDAMRKTCAGLDVEVDSRMGSGKMIDEIFKKYVEPHLIQPTFVTDYPVETAPLAKRHRNNPALTERFEAFVNGCEIANAFSELNDPIDQRERFEAQARLQAMGDDEAQTLDEDFLRALEYGMPPTGGLGIGIDRLVMFLTNAPSIRDVLFFPQMRPE
ncbi:MAG: lysine--tRNA ligase [Candidatus Latescibacterota bacterium]